MSNQQLDTGGKTGIGKSSFIPKEQSRYEIAMEVLSEFHNSMNISYPNDGLTILGEWLEEKKNNS